MSVIVSRTHSEIYMRAPERRAAEEEILVFTAKLNWNTHFEMIVYYIARDGGQLGCPFLSVFRTLMPALLCPHSSLPPLRMSQEIKAQNLCYWFLMAGLPVLKERKWKPRTFWTRSPSPWSFWILNQTVLNMKKLIERGPFPCRSTTRDQPPARPSV